MRPRLITIAFLCLSLSSAGTALAEPLVLTSSVKVTPKAFSPNDDGRSDSTTVTVTLSAPAAITIEVLDADTTRVRLLADGAPAAEGDTTVGWDGLDDADVTVADGGYTVRVTAENGSDPVVASAQVTVDTRAPKFVWRAISPEPIMSARPFHLRFVTGDAEKHLDATVIVFDASGELRRSEGLAVGSGRVSLEQRPRYKDGRPWLPGLYRAQVVLTDEAGNRTRSPLRAFRSHRGVKTRVIHRLSGVGPRVALTFDDCGDGVAWKRILHILADRHAKASFFCLGPYVTRYKAQARRTVADGHTIGSHSMNHALETRLSYSEILRQNRGPQAAWWKVARATPAPYFRPPYGAYDSEVLRAVGDAGYAYTMIWDVDPRDWERPGPAVIANRVLATARSGSIVVMHALKGTAAALPAIITRLRAKGLEPVSLQEMFDRTRTRRPTDAGPVLSHPFE